MSIKNKKLQRAIKKKKIKTVMDILWKENYFNSNYTTNQDKLTKLRQKYILRLNQTLKKFLRKNNCYADPEKVQSLALQCEQPALIGCMQSILYKNIIKTIISSIANSNGKTLHPALQEFLFSLQQPNASQKSELSTPIVNNHNSLKKIKTKAKSSDDLTNVIASALTLTQQEQERKETTIGSFERKSNCCWDDVKTSAISCDNDWESQYIKTGTVNSNKSREEEAEKSWEKEAGKSWEEGADTEAVSSNKNRSDDFDTENINFNKNWDSDGVDIEVSNFNKNWEDDIVTKAVSFDQTCEEDATSSNIMNSVNNWENDGVNNNANTLHNNKGTNVLTEDNLNSDLLEDISFPSRKNDIFMKSIPNLEPIDEHFNQLWDDPVTNIIITPETSPNHETQRDFSVDDETFSNKIDKEGELEELAKILENSPNISPSHASDAMFDALEKNLEALHAEAYKKESQSRYGEITSSELKSIQKWQHEHYIFAYKLHLRSNKLSASRYSSSRLEFIDLFGWDSDDEYESNYQNRNKYLEACARRADPIIARYLMEYYSRKRISNKYVFKSLVCRIADTLIECNEYPSEWDVKAFILKFFPPGKKYSHINEVWSFSIDELKL